MFAPPRMGRLLAVVVFLGAFAFGSLHAHAAAPGCVGITDGVAEGAPQPGKPCWVEVTPYPFGTEGEPVVNPQSPLCSIQNVRPPCHLTVTSLAFRAWNRGLAAARPSAGGTSAFGVWIYNGNRWFPDPTFPGGGACSGSTVLWAGKLDYWLIQGSSDPGLTWSSLCRFDGDAQTWQPLSVPAATKLRTTWIANGQPKQLAGGIRTGTCTAWDSCWFFGSYGTILRWNGTSLQDVSPDPGLVSQQPGQAGRRPLLTGFTDAVSMRDPEGRPAGLAVGTTEGAQGLQGESGALLPLPGGAPPPQLWGLKGTEWNAAPWTPATRPLPDDPFRTDLAAVDLDPTGRGWVAGNPSTRGTGAANPFAASGPSPVTALGLSGPDPACPGPSPDAFGNGAQDISHDAFRWSDLASFPGGRRVLVGGTIKPWADATPPTPTPNGDKSPEPVLVVTDCEGSTHVTRFQTPDPTVTDPNPPLIPANRFEGDYPGMAVAAPADNAGWAATRGPGLLKIPGNIAGQTEYQPPRFYRLTDGQSPNAPAGDDNESRPIPVQEDPPVIVFEPAPPPPAPVPKKKFRSRTKSLPPALFAITSKVTNGRLVITFKVRRAVMIGVAAERFGRVVATTGLRRFRRGPGRLELKLDPKNWPTKISFLSDAPTVVLAAPKPQLTRTITLRATASAIKGRRISSVEFDYARVGSKDWTQVDNLDTKAPFTVTFDTRTVPNGRYRFRAIAFDSAKQSAISKDLPASVIRNRSAS